MAGVGKIGGGVAVGKCVEVGPNLRGVAVKDDVGGIVMVLSATVAAGEVGVAARTGSVNATGEVIHAVRLSAHVANPNRIIQSLIVCMPTVYNDFRFIFSTLVRRLSGDYSP